ncbi:TetR/AcrR family transcriptional regulator [Microvirga sp. W0021]|uniref:TetR/AcrR family transcriptional regulator n=1 Tax=Hohaiivirga grylli TaxID=3133970 RepID=A0ABV0BJ66_9HYPH
MGKKSKSTRDKILDAAEELFALNSYDSVSIRQITGMADVKLGLAHYHFGSKEDLFNAVIHRRIDLLSRCRKELLYKYLEKNDGNPLPVQQLVAAFITPYLYWSMSGGPGWNNYARLVAGLLGYNLKVLQELFDPSAQIFLKEMRRSLPNAEEASIQWGFDFMVGLMCNTFAEVDRIRGLSNGLCSTEQIEDACAYMVSFITHGLTALGQNEKFVFASPLEILHSLDILKSE